MRWLFRRPLAADRVVTWLTWIGLALLIPFASSAKSKQAIFDAPHADVFAACLKVAAREYAIVHSDAPSGTFTFRRGTGKLAIPFTVGVVVEQIEATQARVTANAQKEKGMFGWGKGSRTVKRFFSAVRRELKGDDSSHDNQNAR